MKLSESKLFAIEALNRIEGFEWPEWANYASMCCDGGYHWFWSDKPINNGEMFSASGMVNAVLIGSNHPDWENSLITRAEFESVDGWVRNDLRLIPDCAYEKRVDFVDPECVVWIDYDATMLEWDGRSDGGYVVKWRYHKQPQNQVEQPTLQPTHNIESLISQHKAARLSTLEARRQLEHAEAAEHSLLLSIEEWAESNGFDIRLLDESEENPELVVIDWRDLQKGDVVRWNVPRGSCDYTIDEIFRDSSGGNPCASIISASGSKFTAYPDEIKFIRRPAK